MATVQTTKVAYDDIIGAAAKQYRVDPNLIKAVIATESSWNPKAIRQEPRINDASYGLMQVLLATARSVSGNSGLTANQLMDPATNILIGTKYLASQLARYGNPDDAISAYNGGSALHSSMGGYVNQVYVNRVNANYMFYRGADSLVYMAPAVLLVGALFYFAIWKRR